MQYNIMCIVWNVVLMRVPHTTLSVVLFQKLLLLVSFLGSSSSQFLNFRVPLLFCIHPFCDFIQCHETPFVCGQLSSLTLPFHSKHPHLVVYWASQTSRPKLDSTFHSLFPSFLCAFLYFKPQTLAVFYHTL